MTIEEKFKLAIKFRNANKLQDAIKEFNEIIDNYPNHPKLSRVFTVLGGIYYNLDKHEDSLIYFKKAIELNPKSELASLSLYLSNVELGKSEKAIVELQRYLETCPADFHKTTLEELLGDLENGYAGNFKDIIIELSKKHNIT